VLTLSCGYRIRTDTRGFVYASGRKEGRKKERKGAAEAAAAASAQANQFIVFKMVKVILRLLFPEACS